MMCSLSQQKYFKVPDGQSRQKISERDPAHAALAKKHNDRAVALLKALAPYQTISASSNLSDYPVLAAALADRKNRK